MDAEHSNTQDSLRRVPVTGRLSGDERLARQVARGSEAAFTLIVERYHQQLYRYCRSLTGEDQDAQDALQSAFAKVLVALRADRRDAPLRPWLYRIVHNEAMSVLRGRRHDAELPATLESVIGGHEHFEQRQRFAQLISDLQSLPERQRAALVMRELSGLSHEEIAQVLQVSAGAAKQTILEARRSLQEYSEGRAMECDRVQLIVSAADGRSLRSRRVRAHLRSCSSCAAFAEAISMRRTDMAALWPALPVTGTAALLAKLSGGGAHGGGGTAGFAATGAAKGASAVISLKLAAAAGAVVVATAAVGTTAALYGRPHRVPREQAVAGGSPPVRTTPSSPGGAVVGTGSGVTTAGSPHHARVTAVGPGQRRSGTAIGYGTGTSEQLQSGRHDGRSGHAPRASSNQATAGSGGHHVTAVRRAPPRAAVGKPGATSGRGHPMSSKPVRSKPVGGKPVRSKPVGGKPVRSKPVGTGHSSTPAAASGAAPATGGSTSGQAGGAHASPPASASPTGAASAGNPQSVAGAVAPSGNSSGKNGTGTP